MTKTRLPLACVLLLTASVVALGQATMNVENTTTVVGGTATIDVTVSAVPAPGVTDIQGTITFDQTVMNINDIQGLDGFDSFFFHAIDNVAGTAAFTAAIVGGGGLQAGGVVRIFVVAVGGPGESCFVNIALTVFRASDGTDIPVAVDPGTFTIGTTFPPVADFSFGPGSPTIDDIVQFTDESWDFDGIIVAWNWTFGDGGVSTGVDPAHQYTNAGNFTVTLTVTDNDGAQTSTSQTVTVTGPSAAFNYTPTSPISQEEVQFLDQSVTPTGQIASWSWSFGDGGVSGEQNPTHAYASPGTYRVDLTITTSLGPTVSTFRYITVRNAPPQAEFDFNPAQPKIGEMVTFGAGGSSDPDGSVVIFEWDFDNDGVTDATGSTVTHAFDIVGARPVTLKVTDDDGAFDYKTRVVPVQASPPVAAFTFAPAAPNTGQTVAFDASTSADPDGTIILYEWDFDNDGVTDATGMAATHSWPAPGVYPVTLIVTDNDGSFGADTQAVPVQVGGTGGDNQPPVADFTFEPEVDTEVNINEVVNFRADGSSDPDGSIAAYEWDFNNDGVYDATGANAARVFVTGGAKIVTLRVTDDDGAVGFKTKVVAVQFVRPTAAFIFTPAAPEVGEVVTFDASDSFDDDGRVDFFEWDFDDDGVPDGTGMTVNHVFTAGGGIPVTLTVTDNDGVVDFTTLTVPVTINAPPIADFDYTPANPTTADNVEFSSTSTDADGNINAYLWDFGDLATSTVQTPSHRYAAAGTYAVTLTVRDDDGATAERARNVVVGAVENNAPVANFTFAPALPGVNQQIAFTDTSTDPDGAGDLDAWAWDFGDQGTSTLRNPTHTYAAAGTYTVELTVTDDAGATSTVTKQVTVAAGDGAEIAVFTYPNPASTLARIAFALPAGATNTLLRIFSIIGVTVFEVQIAVGETEYLWNLRGLDGVVVGNGLYHVVVTATNANGRTVASEAFRLLIAR